MLFKGRHSLLWDTVDQKQFFPFKSIRKSTSLAECSATVLCPRTVGS